MSQGGLRSVEAGAPLVETIGRYSRRPSGLCSRTTIGISLARGLACDARRGAATEAIADAILGILAG